MPLKLKLILREFDAIGENAVLETELLAIGLPAALHLGTLVGRPVAGHGGLPGITFPW